LALIIVLLLLLVLISIVVQEPKMLLLIPLVVWLIRAQAKFEAKKESEREDRLNEIASKIIPAGDSVVQVGECELYSSNHPLLRAPGEFHYYVVVTDSHLVFSRDGVSAALVVPISGAKSEIASRKSVSATNLALFGILGLTEPFKKVQALLLIQFHDPRSGEDYAVAFSKYTSDLALAIDKQRYAVLAGES